MSLQWCFGHDLGVRGLLGRVGARSMLRCVMLNYSFKFEFHKADYNIYLRSIFKLH